MFTSELTAEKAVEKLKKGNEIYIDSETGNGNISKYIRKFTFENGQRPYAVVVTCSDSRVIPESIFNAGIGELFVIRIAGNVIDNHQLGSIEYAAEHLGCPLILVLGHNHCGAVDAAINHSPNGYIKYITDEILSAIGEEKDEFKACCLNVQHSVEMIENNIDIKRLENEYGLCVYGAIYNIESGKVEFLNKQHIL